MRETRCPLISKILPELRGAPMGRSPAGNNARNTAISMKLKDSGSREIKYTEFRMIIESLDKKFEFMTGEDDPFINLLRTVYGDWESMPFGYFKSGGATIKFF